MLLDILFAIVLVLAIWKGFRQGLIVGLFSLVAVIVGLAAAMKLSAVVATYIGSAVKISQQWLPVISFIVVFIIVLLLIRLAARAIQRTAEIAMLGWVNRLGGVIFYVAMYTIIFSVVLFYAEKMQLVKPATIHASVVYPVIQPWGPKAIDGFGRIVPLFRNMFTELGDFFEGVSKKIPNP